MKTLETLPEGSRRFFTSELNLLPNGSIALNCNYDGDVLKAEPPVDIETARSCYVVTRMIKDTISAMLSLAEAADQLLAEEQTTDDNGSEDNDIPNQTTELNRAGELKQHGRTIH